MSYQACVGPSGNRVHVRDTDDKSGLTICELTAPARLVKGKVFADCLCGRCMRRVWETQVLPGETITAEMIGVTEII
jgi:hypothetical protein